MERGVGNGERIEASLESSIEGIEDKNEGQGGRRKERNIKEDREGVREEKWRGGEGWRGKVRRRRDGEEGKDK